MARFSTERLRLAVTVLRVSGISLQPHKRIWRIITCTVTFELDNSMKLPMDANTSSLACFPKALPHLTRIPRAVFQEHAHDAGPASDRQGAFPPLQLHGDG